MKKIAFTLTEVLITMTLIGVVAALTVPQIMSDATTKGLKTKFRATFVSLQHGFDISATYDLPVVKWGKDAANNADVISAHLTPNLKKYFNAKSLNVADDETITMYLDEEKTFEIAAKYRLSNGSFLYIPEQTVGIMKDSGCRKPTKTAITNNDTDTMCVVFLDVNGKTAPNETIMCNSGDNSLNISASCSVDDVKISDIYPLVLTDKTIKPLTNAVQVVLDE